MKTSHNTPRLLIPLLSLTLLTLPGLSAQTDPGTNAATPGTNSCPAQAGGGWHHHGPGMLMQNLTPAERQQLITDFMQVKDNPQFLQAAAAVATATQTLIQTGATLMLQTDPSVQPILAKIQPQVAQMIQQAQMGQFGQGPVGQTNN